MTKFIVLTLLALLSAIILSGCGEVPVVNTPILVSPTKTAVIIPIETAVSTSNEPAQTDTPVADTLNYHDETFNITLAYPSDWNLIVESAEDGGAKALRFQKETWILVIYHKFVWDQTGFGGGLPLGEVVERGTVPFLGHATPRYFVVHENKDKVMFINGRFEDIEFYVELISDPETGGNYYDIDMPDFLYAEVDSIISSIIRTGEPSTWPTPTLFPPTPLPPTPFPPTPTTTAFCDQLAFIEDVTIPDGTILEAGQPFVKTWRIRNQGFCTWTANYALVFFNGAQLGNTVAVNLPHNVSPGSTVDLSVTLTAPSITGSHRSYWMLSNASGSLFGFGTNADKPFYVDIYSTGSSFGTVSGRICYPSEQIPPMTLYLSNTTKNKLTEIAINENQTTYQVQLEPGIYLAYAWTLNFEMAGGYTLPDHRLRSFEVAAGSALNGIDICDWYGEPGTIPLPNPDNFGSISGRISYPGEQIPPLRIVAFDIYNNAAHWVDTTINQQTYEITNLMPGYYTIIAYEKSSGLAGGYTKAVVCDLSTDCSEDHTLVVVYITPGLTATDINPTDWYAPVGTYPPDPTY